MSRCSAVLLAVGAEEAHDRQAAGVTEGAQHGREIDLVGARMVDRARHWIAFTGHAPSLHELGTTEGEPAHPRARPFTGAGSLAVRGRRRMILLALATSSTPTPLDAVYAARWHVSASSLTEVSPSTRSASSPRSCSPAGSPTPSSGGR